MIIDPITCPFETKPQEVLGRFNRRGEEWLLLPNIYTPYQNHRLVIPIECWPIEKLRTLGGSSAILSALEILTETMATLPSDRYITIIHIGASAGQNLGHLHWHVYSFGSGPPGYFESYYRAAVDNPSLQIAAHGDITACAGGCRTGQCFLANRSSQLNLADLSELLDRVISLYSSRFQSSQGLAPDYSIGLVFSERGDFEHGLFTPILNNRGAGDELAMMGDGMMTLAWPHEKTVEHLRGDS